MNWPLLTKSGKGTQRGQTRHWTSFRQLAIFQNGQRVSLNEPVPEWHAPSLA